jgi:hypothetical protein
MAFFKKKSVTNTPYMDYWISIITDEAVKGKSKQNVSMLIRKHFVERQKEKIQELIKCSHSPSQVT